MLILIMGSTRSLKISHIFVAWSEEDTGHCSNDTGKVVRGLWTLINDADEGSRLGEVVRLLT